MEQVKTAAFSRAFNGMYTALSLAWTFANAFAFKHKGGNTIWKLQQLLATPGVFPTELGPDPGMILSATMVSSPLKGTQVVYILGARPEAPGRCRRFSFGGWLTAFVHIYEYLDVKWLKKVFYDFHVDHWNFSWKSHRARSEDYCSGKSIHCDEDAVFGASNGISEISSCTINTKREVESIGYGLLECLRDSPWMNGKDNAPHDMTFHSMMELNRSTRMFPHTYYQSVATSVVSTVNEKLR
jgi:hypothetical protein